MVTAILRNFDFLRILLRIKRHLIRDRDAHLRGSRGCPPLYLPRYLWVMLGIAPLSLRSEKLQPSVEWPSRSSIEDTFKPVRWLESPSSQIPVYSTALNSFYEYQNILLRAFCPGECFVLISCRFTSTAYYLWRHCDITQVGYIRRLSYGIIVVYTLY